MHHLELRTELDEMVLKQILELIEDATRIEGHRPVGEHKYAHLRVGARDFAGVMAYEDGRLLGYAHLRWNTATTPVPRVAVEVVVHPDFYDTDVARTLLHETRAVLAAAGGGRLWLWVHRVIDAETTLAAQLGFRIQRELAFMVRALDEPPPRLAFPRGVTLRPYQGNQDDPELLRVNNAAFGDHPENGGWDQTELDDRRSRDWFDPAGLLLAWRGDELLGFHWTKWHSHSGEPVPAHEPQGEVYVLAVDPAAQGLGLGRALLHAGLDHLQRRGCRNAVLYVDCANTPAVKLYESEGFTDLYHDVCYEDVVVPVARVADLARPA